MIRAEILLQGGHTVEIPTGYTHFEDAAERFMKDLKGGFQIFADQYLIHPGSVSAIRFYDSHTPAAEEDGNKNAERSYEWPSTRSVSRDD
jgi:hypothetical protein